MAAEPTPSREQEILEQALQEYTRRATELPQVVCIAYVPGPERDVFVYIDKNDRDVMDQLFDIEETLFEMYDDQLFDFHIRFLEGQDLRTPTSSRLVYSRA